MKRIKIITVIALVSYAGTVFANCGSCETTKPKKEITHRFLAFCVGKKKIMIVGKDSKIEREITGTGNSQDAWMLKNGNILYSHFNGAREVDKDNKVVWEYKANGCEVHSAQPLPNGNVLIGESGKSRLVEVDRDSKIVKEIKVETTDKSHHYQFRTCRKTKKGKYLVACLGDGIVRELDKNGKLLRELIPNEEGKAKKNNAHAVVPMPNGHILVSTGYGKGFVEFDKKGKIIWTLSEKDLPGAKMTYACSIQQLPNGNRVFAVYRGNPQFIEVDKDKNIVWSYHNNSFGNVSGILILDDGKDPAKGKVIR